jgi:hypothetical protein
MNNEQKSFRERLLAQGQPAADKLVRYQQETEAMIERMETGLRREKWGVGAIWCYAVLLNTAMLLLVGYFGHAPELWMLATAFVILIYGAVEIVKHFINRSRVEILKELKGLELQVHAIQERMSDLPR